MKNQDLALKIATSNELELVAIQYDIIIEEVTKLKSHILNEEKEQSFICLDKIRDVLSGLIATLGDENTDFKEKTTSLYIYFTEKLNEAVLNDDISELTPISKNLTTLRDAWLEAGANIRKDNPSNNKVSNAVTYGKKDINLNGSTTDLGSV